MHVSWTLARCQPDQEICVGAKRIGLITVS